MKRIYIIITALMALCTASQAQVSGMNVGYCMGYMGDNPSSMVSTVKGDQVSAAIYVPADQIRAYAGNHIDEINVGLASKLNVQEVQVWVRSELEGDNLAEGSISSGLQKEWNAVSLSQPYDITEETPGLYIGYTYTQKGTSKAIAVIELPQPNALYLKLGTEAEWTDRSAEGALCIEAMVYGDNLPKHNLSLLSMSVQPVFVVDDPQLKVTAMVRNSATVTITGFDAVCQVDGTDETYTAHIDQTLAYNEFAEVEFTISPTAITSADPEYRTLTVTIDNLNEGADEAMSDNTLQGTFQVVMHNFTRMPLIEEFTTEKCLNCPRVGGYLHSLIEDERFAGKVNIVEHHSGYYTDKFTIQADTQWEWFYDNVYAPAMMLNRTAEYGDAPETAIFNPGSLNELSNYVMKELLKPAFVSLKIDVQPDEQNYELNITVTGERSKSNLTENPARITVMLVESGLVSEGTQAGYSGDYPHLNIGRRVNAVWGDVIEWDGDNYSYQCTLKYSPSYVKQNLGILAFIHDGDTNDKLAWEVCNSAYTNNMNFNTATGISQSFTDGLPAERYYNAAGQQVDGMKPGLNIIRSRDGRVRKTMQK